MNNTKRKGMDTLEPWDDLRFQSLSTSISTQLFFFPSCCSCYHIISYRYFVLFICVFGRIDPMGKLIRVVSSSSNDSSSSSSCENNSINHHHLAKTFHQRHHHLFLLEKTPDHQHHESTRRPKGVVLLLEKEAIQRQLFC
jgi:hypothetical protein